jgi:hypothetical protein
MAMAMAMAMPGSMAMPEPMAAPTPTLLADPRTLPPASGYAYLLPGGWVHLDLEPSRRVASVRKALTQRARREPRLAVHLARLERMLLEECATAAAAGAERVSLLAEPVDGRAGTAAVTFSVESLPDGAGPIDAAGIMRGLGYPESAESGPSGPSAGIVELTQLTAVRRAWVDTRLVGVQGPIATRQWQLLVPWPGLPRVGLLTMSSPCRPLWPLLALTFDACAQSFHWTWPIPEQGRSSSPGSPPD